MKKSEEMKRAAWYAGGGIAADRLAQKASLKYLSMPLWMIATSVTLAYYGTVAILEWMVSEEDDPYLQEFLEITFPSNIPFIGMVPWGLLGPTEFSLGMKLGEAINPISVIHEGKTPEWIFNQMVTYPVLDYFDQPTEVYQTAFSLLPFGNF